MTPDQTAPAISGNDGPKTPEAATLEGLFADLESPLHGYALKLTQRPEIAQDLVQEAFMRLHARFNDVRQPRLWLYRTVHNLAMNHHRAEKKIVAVDFQSEGEENVATVDLDATPDEQLQRSEAIGRARLGVAEIGAAESGTALYSIQADPKGSGPIGVARIRFMNPATGRYEEQSWPLAYDRNSPTLDQAAPSIRLAACAAAFAEWLARSPYAAEVTPDALLGYLNEAVENYALDARPRQLQSMIQHARSMGGQ